MEKRVSQKSFTYGSNYIKKLKTTYSHAALCNNITRGDPASMGFYMTRMDPQVKPGDDNQEGCC